MTIYQDIRKMILQIYFYSNIEFHLSRFVEDKDIFTLIYIIIGIYTIEVY